MMKNTPIRPLAWAALLGASVLASGCVNRPPSLYEWGGYQPQVYEYFKSDNKGPEAQASALEADLQKIAAKGAKPPPGYHAHLGLLYANMGRDDQAVQSFQAEKALFPEAAHYMDFLLVKSKDKDKK